MQYKVINEVPMLVGLNEGASLLTELFLKIKELNINGQTYPLFQKNLDHTQAPAGLTNHLKTYRFANLWMALNQENYQRYRQLERGDEKQSMLATLLKNNLLSFFKGVGIWLEAPVISTGIFTELTTQFKNQPMLAFSGEFSANVLVPKYIGLGKAVARGFGTVVEK